jgi:hypothetical protein
MNNRVPATLPPTPEIEHEGKNPADPGASRRADDDAIVDGEGYEISGPPGEVQGR